MRGKLTCNRASPRGGRVREGFYRHRPERRPMRRCVLNVRDREGEGADTTVRER